ncbi:MAG: ABC transporter permease [Pseudomonadota bacterium]
MDKITQQPATSWEGPTELSLYWRFVLASFKSQMQFKLSFFLSAVGGFSVTIIEVAAIWALFTRFGNLPDWNMAQVCMFYGLVNMSFSISEALATGFDQFGTAYVRTGNFDRLLLRPRSLFVQLMGHELSLRRVGRFSQGLVVFSWALVSLDVQLDSYQAFMIALTMASAVCFFLALFIFQATLCFWSTESLEIMNTLTYGGVESAQYPMAIYEEWFTKFFTYVIPLACISYFPVVAILGVEDPLGTSRTFQTLAPLSGMLFLALAILVFQTIGVRHYTSTGN